MRKRNMRREMITEDELRGQLRQQGVADLAEVKEARLESDGQVGEIKRE